jgi:hypothetical protein
MRFMSNRVTTVLLRIAALMPDRAHVWVARSKAAPLLRSVITHQPATVGAARIAAGPARDLLIVTNYSLNRAYFFGTYEPENVAVIKQVCQPGMTVMDVGAHEGYLTLVMAAKVGSSGQVFAFEPCLKTTVD